MPHLAISISQELLLKTRKRQAVEETLNQLSSISEQALLRELPQDEHKLVFWINVYNAFIQLKLRAQTGTPHTNSAFFQDKHIQIAGRKLSFDDIEHQIIRGGRFKYGLGFIPSLYQSAFFRKHRVRKPDYRIHFALNCGAKSCPPIAYYDLKGLNEQLEIATSNYITQSSRYDELSNQLFVSRLFLWFMGDFGGKSGIRKLLLQHRVYPQEKRPKLSFDSYDWSVVLEEFSRFPD